MRAIAVTGGASGIGLATVELARARGWHAVAIDRVNADVVADLSTATGRKSAVAAVNEKLAGAPLDAVIACAGVASRGHLPGNAETIARVNYFGAVEVLEGLLPMLARGSAPRAVAFSSTALLRVPPAWSPVVDTFLRGDEAETVAALLPDAPGAYAASKRALALWVRREAVSERWAGAGVLLNAIAPGAVDTPMLHEPLADPETRAMIGRLTPMRLGRPGEARELAALACFMASRENSYMAGQTIFCDGGAEATLRPGLV